LASAAEPLIGVPDEALDLRIEVGEDGMARIIRLAARDAPEPPDGPGPERPAHRATTEWFARRPTEPPVPTATELPVPTATELPVPTAAGPQAAVASGAPAGAGAEPPPSGRMGPPSPDRTGPLPAARTEPADAALPLLDVVLAGEGKTWSGDRYCESAAGGRFRYVGHDQADLPGGWHELRVELADPVSGLRAEVFYRVLSGRGALRCWVRLANHGPAPVTVESVTSFLCGGLTSAPRPAATPDNVDDLDVLWAENDWLAEGRWQRRRLRDALPDLNRQVHGADPRGRFGLTSAGTWSSGGYLPMGAVVSRSTGHAWAWQIEHNGGWHWQTGECTHRYVAAGSGPHGGHAPAGSASGAYLALLGPADTEHAWNVTLPPGGSFTTVPVAVAVSASGFEGAVGALTAVRRAVRRPHEDGRNLPMIFNDYMNTLMGNPTTERLLPLIDAAAEVGAEYFCIDSGWYADADESWWDTVGAWKPSATRFPNGIGEVLDHIRAAGMIPGLWLEPEVVGVHSPVVLELPPEAFFQRDGRLVTEHGRHHLDLRHAAAVKHLDQVVDFIVGDLGVGYLKLDYNIEIAPGPTTGGLSPGAGLLEANRAQLDWVDGVLDRHPHLVLENCSSGGMRVDYALLSRFQLQSTSDQQDPFRYPPIAAAAPAAIAPEQAANWAYPQPSFTDDEIAFTLCGTLLGRMYLSGHLDHMSRDQRALVAEAVRVHKELRGSLAGALPFWPLGLPRWTDPWIALGLRTPEASYLTVWHRAPVGAEAGATGPWAPGEAAAGGVASGGQPGITLPVPHLRGKAVIAEVLYPGAAGTSVAWDAAAGTLSVDLPRVPSGCLIRLVR
jgi:alpha-galactosidase